MVIREDRELLTELARLNTDMTSLCMRIMDDSATASEQQRYAERLIATGERLSRRAEGIGGVAVGGTVIEGEVVKERVTLTSGDRDKKSIALPQSTVEPDWKP